MRKNILWRSRVAFEIESGLLSSSTTKLVGQICLMLFSFFVNANRLFRVCGALYLPQIKRRSNEGKPLPYTRVSDAIRRGCWFGFTMNSLAWFRNAELRFRYLNSFGTMMDRSLILDTNHLSIDGYPRDSAYIHRQVKWTPNRSLWA